MPVELNRVLRGRVWKFGDSIETDAITLSATVRNIGTAGSLVASTNELPYACAKAGLNAYLQGLRARLFRAGVSVTTVKAGFLDTAMTFGLPGMFLVASPEACARACLGHAAKGREVAYFPIFWWGIMTIIRAIPERIFKRLSI